MDPTWIDPFDMNLKSEPSSNANVNPIQDHVYNNNEICDCAPTLQENLASAYYKRIINMLLADVSLDSNDDSLYTGYISANMPKENYNTLKKFISNPVLDKKHYEQVDLILQYAYKKSTAEQFSNLVLSWQEYLYLYVTLRSIGIFLGSIFAVILCIKLYRAKVTVWKVVKILIFLGWIVDYAFTWMHLYQVAEVNKMVDILKLKSIPENCDPEKVGTLKRIWQFLSGSDECRQYHQAMYSDIFWSVGPLTVLSEQLLVPATNIGGAFGNVIKGILGSLPWGINYVLLPVLLIFLCIFLCLTLSFVTDTNFELNLFHMIKFKFNNDNRREIGNVFYRIVGNTDGVITSGSHRPMIEEVVLERKQIENKNIKTSESENINKNSSVEMNKENEGKKVGADIKMDKEETKISEETTIINSEEECEVIKEKDDDEKSFQDVAVQTSYLKR